MASTQQDLIGPNETRDEVKISLTDARTAHDISMVFLRAPMAFLLTPATFRRLAEDAAKPSELAA